MSTVRKLHAKAMMLAQSAQLARVRDHDITMAEQLSREAFKLEAQAAELVPNTREAEPTRSILYRSAASLAYQCRDYESAQRFVMRGMSGYPPPRELQALEMLYEQIRFAAYLLNNRLTITAAFQIVLRGKGVDYGKVPYDEFQSRTTASLDLIHRGVERKSGRSYRKQGSINPKLRPFTPLIAPQPAGSFVMYVELAQPEYEAFQETYMFTLDALVDETLQGINLVGQGQREQLRELIPDESYYRNFIAGAKRIAPDGEIISQVGLADISSTITITTPQRNIPVITPSERKTTGISAESQIVTILGILDYANDRSRASSIGLTTYAGKTYDVEMLEGLEDFVKSYFKDDVYVTGRLVSETKIIAEDVGPAKSQNTTPSTEPSQEYF